MSIWMWSMKLRFQIGSNRPLAKRKARMFWAASLPRKWSIRKICRSRKVSCTLSFRVIALCRSVPNGFSITTRDRSTRSASRSSLDHRRRRRRRHAQVVQPTHRAAQLLLGDLDRLGEAFRSGRLRHVGEPLGERVPLLRGQRVVAELVHRLLGEAAERLLVVVLQRRADHLDVRRQGRQGQVREAGDQLAPGQVAGRAEQHDHVGRDDVGPPAARPERRETDRQWSAL